MTSTTIRSQIHLAHALLRRARAQVAEGDTLLQEALAQQAKVDALVARHRARTSGKLVELRR